MNSRLRWTFAITSLALFAFTLDRLVVATALPAIRADLGAQLAGLEWTVNAYTLSFAVLLLTGGALGDRFGRRRMFTIGVAVFTAGSAAAALAPTIGALVAARAVQGAGRRAVHAADADHALGGDAARAARRRARRVGRGRRPGRGPRPARGRRSGRRRRLAGHLLAERAAGPGADAAGPAEAGGVLRLAAETGPGRCRAGQRRAVRRGLGGDPGRRGGMGEHRGVGPAEPAAPRCWCCSSSGRRGRQRRCCRCASSAAGCSRPARWPRS